MRCVHAIGWPLAVETGRHAVVVVGPVHAVADVFLTAPDNLHRAIHPPRDLDGEQRAVGVQATAKATAEKVVVDSDRGFRQPGQFRHHALRPRWRLRPHPDIAAVLGVVDGAVHRLHRGMREERHLVHRVKPLRRAGEGLVSVAARFVPQLRAAWPPLRVDGPPFPCQRSHSDRHPTQSPPP